MTKGTANIVATPSKIPEGLKSSVELEASSSKHREDKYKYIDEYGLRSMGNDLLYCWTTK